MGRKKKGVGDEEDGVYHVTLLCLKNENGNVIDTSPFYWRVARVSKLKSYKKNPRKS